MSDVNNFWRYFSSNPEVWNLFCRFARQARDRGFTHYSAKLIYNLIRWHTDVVTKTPDNFKLNDRYHSWYGHLYNFLFGSKFFRERGNKDFADIMSNLRKANVRIP